MITRKRIGSFIVEGEYEDLNEYKLPEEYYAKMSDMKLNFRFQTFGNFLHEMKNLQKGYISKKGFKIIMEAELRKELMVF